MIKLKDILFEEDYKGEHESPDKDNGVPLYNLTGIYPEDIYSYDAARLYGDNHGDNNDKISIYIIQYCKNKPHNKIKIYRAIPYTLTSYDLINKYEDEKRYILKYKKMPPNSIRKDLTRPDYYEFIDNEIERLKNSPKIEEKDKLKINADDWVSINKNYAISHGRENLNNKFKLLSKTVHANELYTDGNSIHEWGYQPV
jgi:hypothetical protein